MAHEDIPILVVDDASPDGTGEVADALAAQNPRLHVLHRAGKLGLGTAYLDPELLLSRAVVARTPTSSNSLGMGVGRAAVQVIVPADRVGAVISSVDQEAKVTLVPSPGGADASS